MVVLLGSDTVAAISQSTGCFGLNLATTAFFFFFSSCHWPMWLSLCSFYAVKVPACKHNTSTYAFSHTFSSGLFWEMLHLFP